MADRVTTSPTPARWVGPAAVMPPGVPAVAGGLEVAEGSSVGADDGRPDAEEEGPSVGRPLAGSVGAEVGGALEPSAGAEVAVDPGAAGVRTWPGRVGPAPERPEPSAGAGAPITLGAICCTGSGRFPV